jgi:hypothetical protein
MLVRCLWVVLPWLMAACIREQPLSRQLVAADRAAQIDPKVSPILKAHMKDGRVFVFSKWTVNEKGRIVTGVGHEINVAREPGRSGSFEVRFDDVALFETNEPIRSSPGLASMAVVTGVSLVITAACILNPKSCFGSCPTFYVWDGERSSLQAEGFSDSIAPALEATDIDALYRARPIDQSLRSLTIRMTNEALETHVVKSVELLSVPRPPGARVVHAAGDGFYLVKNLRPPDHCVAPEGPCEAALQSFDGKERSSLADSGNLATREDVTLSFDGSMPGQMGLVVAARQTLLTTFLLYQGLAYLGREAPAALAELQRDPSLRKRVEETHRLLGGIEVHVRAAGTGGGWESAGEIFETGPIASDVHLVRFPSPSTGPVQVRLRMTRGDWRLDWVALAHVDERVEPRHIIPHTIKGKTDDGRQVTMRSGETIVTLPGDVYDLTFDLPEHPERHELFLSSRGYYLEWMRQQWLAEESRARAAMMLYTPSIALRVLAPAYHKQEADMERLFWESRYARP